MNLNQCRSFSKMGFSEAMAFVGFSRQCEHKTALKLPAHRNFCPVPIWSAPVCTTTSTRGSVSKLHTSLQKAIRGGKRPTFCACVIAEGVVSVSREGPETPTPAVALRAVQHRSGAGTQAWIVLCVPCTTKSCLSAGMCWKAQTKGCSDRGHCTPSCEPISALQ